MAQVFAAAPRSFPRFVRYGSNVERLHPRDRHWYLVVLGVEPRAQHRGLGRAPLEAGLRQTDSDPAACYLETSDPANVDFYARFGFVVSDSELEAVVFRHLHGHRAYRRGPRTFLQREGGAHPSGVRIADDLEQLLGGIRSPYGDYTQSTA